MVSPHSVKLKSKAKARQQTPGEVWKEKQIKLSQRRIDLLFAGQETVGVNQSWDSSAATSNCNSASTSEE